MYLRVLGRITIVVANKREVHPKMHKVDLHYLEEYAILTVIPKSKIPFRNLSSTALKSEHFEATNLKTIQLFGSNYQDMNYVSKSKIHLFLCCLKDFHRRK